MTQPWFRFYSEMLNDRKIEYLCRTTQQPKALVIGVWSTILALANDSPMRGVLLLTESIPLTADDLARETGLDNGTMERFIYELHQLEMMCHVDGAFVLVNWDKRQFASDNSTERVRQWRARQSNGDEADTGNDTDDEASNVAVTFQQRDGNGPDTDTDTDTDAETETELVGANAPTPDKPPPKRTRQKKPTAKTPAAISVFRANAHRYPAKAWFDAVASVVGDAPDDLERWGRVVFAWVGQGWNPTNVSGMLECYQRGEIPGEKPQRQRDDERKWDGVTSDVWEPEEKPPEVDLWQAILAEFKLAVPIVPPEMLSAQPVGLCDGVLSVALPDGGSWEFIEARLRAKLDTAVAQVDGGVRLELLGS